MKGFFSRISSTLVIALILACSYFSGCNASKDAAKSAAASTAGKAASPAEKDTSLRAVDFKNFTYDNGEQKIQLKDGLWETKAIMENTDRPELAYEFVDVQFGDFLGNGGEQAAAMLSAVTPGASCCEWKEVYIFDNKDGRPKQVATLNAEGMAVIPDKGVVAAKTPLYDEDDGHCCPSNVMITQYRCGKKGMEKSRVQVFPTDNLPDEITDMDLDYTPAELPEIYKDDLACPFECCAFGQWTAQETFTVYEKSDETSEIIERIDNGESFDALTGIAYVKPGKLNIVKYYSDPWTGIQLDAGEQIYELTYLGEGWSKYWYHGYIGNTSMQDICGHEYATPECWLERVSEPESTWWVRVKLSDGALGWIKDPFNVDGAYGC
jgi:hypothetical protein